MKYLNWNTSGLPKQAKMSHKLRAMMKRRQQAQMQTRNIKEGVRHG